MGMCFRPKDVPSKKVVLVELERAKVVLEKENATLRAKLKDVQEYSARACKERDGLNRQRFDLEAQLQQRTTYVGHLLTQVSSLRGNLTTKLHELLDHQAYAATGQQVHNKLQAEASSAVNLHVVQPECLEGAPHSTDPASECCEPPASTAAASKAISFTAQAELASQEDSSVAVDEEGRKLTAQEQLDRHLTFLAEAHERAVEHVSRLQAQLRQAEEDKAALRVEVAGVRRRLEQAEANANDQQQTLQKRCAALEQENEQLTGMNQEMQQQLEAALDELSASKKQWTADSGQLAKQAEELEAANGRLVEMEAEARSLQARLAASEAQAQEATAKATTLQEQVAARTSALEAARSALGARDAELETARSELQQLQSLACNHKELYETVAAELAKQTAELEGTNSRLEEMAAEARSLQAQLAEVDAQAQEATARATMLQEQVADRTSALEAASLALGARDAELETARSELQQLQSLASHHKQLYDTMAAELRDVQESRRTTKEALEAATEQLEVARRDLAVCQQQLTASAQELSDTQTLLQESRASHSATRERLNKALEELQGNETRLAEANKQYLTTKQSVISTAKQLASMAKDHSAALDKLHALEAEAAGVREQLAVMREAEATSRAQAEASGAAAREARKAADQAEAEARRLRVAYDEAAADLRRKIMLLTAIARMANKGQSVHAASGGRLRDGQDADHVDSYGAVTSEQQLRLKVCESPLPLLGALTAGIMDSSRLRHLSLDMDTSREVTWEKAGLRICCLAAAIGLNNSLQTLQLCGWTWGELGNGTALPFLALGGGGGLASGMLRSVQLATNLFDVEAAAMLRDLLAAGLVELAAGGDELEEAATPRKDETSGAQGMLLLYSGNERLDGWYHDMLLLSRLEPTAQPAPSGSASLDASGAISAPPAETSTAVECDLSSEALESHHVVLIMTVLLTCPQLRRLRLDGNKLGDGGAALLALGLSGNTGLRELYLSRNGIRAAGARSLARCLEGANATLLRLDMSGQRLEGLGVAGAEAMAQALRVNRTLEDLNLANCGITGAAAACFAGAIRAAGATRPRSCSSATSLSGDASNRPLTAGGSGSLRRLVLSGNNIEAATAKALVAAAAERPGLVLCL
ncbi:hypothetical protein Agub_g9342 [Astrephomene gubernaculifera]|uniref:Uncharacterized protein n=1 Tax=Astrephomene gubernaculifera TaxID=47775 RepID=A0AAD3DT94_9CHLO|nr:hypothetical protein Agub_g9342 [Astrephomene gubernaculifera]